MKLIRKSDPRRVFVMLPLLGALASASVLPLACSDEACTTGTVGLNLAIPEGLSPTVVDVTFAYDERAVHRQTLMVTAGASRVSAAVTLPEGYPEGKYVSVFAVAKGGDAATQAPVGTWYVSQTFPKGCVAFVGTLFPFNANDAGDMDGGFFFDGAVGDAGPPLDAGQPPVDGGNDALGGDADLGDAAAADAAPGDADVDASVI